MRVGIVGAGPGGSLLAYRLARDGAFVTLFDASHPREKPCGGGVTRKALALLPPAPVDDPVPLRWIDCCRFDCAGNGSVEVALDEPIGLASRLELDGWLLRRAVAAGARHVAESVVALEGTNDLRTRTGPLERFDVIVGADGVTSVVRRARLGPLPSSRLAMATGWRAQGDTRMSIRFLPPLAGYLWLFPRADHVAVGICAPLGATPTRELRERLERETASSFPAVTEPRDGRYAHLIPSPSADPQSILEIGAERWALVGDAAALADPITGEGIHAALLSATVLAETLREQASAAGYPERVLEGFGRELLRAAALRERFYAAGFTERMVRFAARSGAIREVLADLVLGEQGYLGLKWRLLRAAPRFAWDSLVAMFGPGR